MINPYQSSTEWDSPARHRSIRTAPTGVTVLLAALLYLAVAAVVDQTILPQHWPLAVTVSTGAFILGLLMAYSRFDALFALSYGLFVGLAWIIGVMGQAVTQKEISVLHLQNSPQGFVQPLALLVALSRWWIVPASLSEEAQTLALSISIAAVLWWITYLGVWAMLRHGYGWSSVASAGVALAFCSRWTTTSLLGWVTLFCAAALLLLIQFNLRERQVGWRTRQVYVQPTIHRHFLYTGLGFGIAVLLAAWLMPPLEPSTWVQRLIAKLEPPTGRSCLIGRCSSTEFGTQLPLLGPRSVDDTPVLRVATTGKRYWRSVVFDRYEGRGWSASLAEIQPFAANVPLATTEETKSLWVTQTMTLLLPAQTDIVGAQEIRQISLPVEAQVHPADQGAGQEITRFQAQIPLHRDEQYTVVSQAPAATEAELAAAGEDYPAFVRHRYLQLPADFSPRIAATALEITQAATTPFAKARAVESFLRNYRYDDQIPAPPADADPIEYFLYTKQAGYCDYYASAMALMLRSLGIPARVASGYAQGEWEENTKAYLVRSRDAHTWVEVFFPGIGWIEFEPTANQAAIPLPVNPQAIANEPPTIVPTPTQASQTGAPPEQQGGEQIVPPPVTWWRFAPRGRNLVLTLLVAVLGLVLLFTWRNRRHQTRPELPFLLYLGLLQWAARLGVPLRPSDTPYEQARHFAQRVPAGRWLIQTVVGGYVHFLFGRKESINLAPVTDHAAQVNLLKVWRQLQPILWKAWVQHQMRFLFQPHNPFHLHQNKL